jgi:hypothetical protein
MLTRFTDGSGPSESMKRPTGELSPTLASAREKLTPSQDIQLFPRIRCRAFGFRNMMYAG